MYKRMINLSLAVAIGLAAQATTVQAQVKPTTGKAQAALDQGAESGKLTFLIFYKDDSPSFRRMTEVVKAGVERHPENSQAAQVQVTSGDEQAVIERFQLSRAPLPLTLAVAPNGAVTGIFAKEISEDRFEEAFVTPTMMRCMKSLQENQLVFVCISKTEKAIVPTGVKDMQKDPHFKDRIVVVSMQLNDPEETKFLNQMKINPQTPMLGTTAVLLAPPGVLIGKFDSTSSASQIASTLHDAGKCCDDPNCKHNHSAPAQATKPTAAKRK